MWSNFLAQTPHNIPNSDNNKDEENAKNNNLVYREIDQLTI